MDHPFHYGIIEGFYGRSWAWQTRALYAEFLKAYGFGFYIYAPKDDVYLRRKWRDSWPESQVQNLMGLAAAYQRVGVSWGVGLSPFEIYLDFDDEAKQALKKKVLSINELNPDILCVLLDDMKGDVPRLAEMQVDVFQFIADLSTARRLILCPTYYSFDPILERVFGQMPDGYWQTLGNGIDLAVDIFWTGPQVCSTEYPETHLIEVAECLGRKPFIWDNYPVNDSEKRSKTLLLRGYENRPHQMRELVSGHAVNPMNQAWLSQIPLRTLCDVYRLQDDYHSKLALNDALIGLCGEELGKVLREDVVLFQDQGLDEIDEVKQKALVQKYKCFESPYAHDVVDWLCGKYAFDPACLTA